MASKDGRRHLTITEGSATMRYETRAEDTNTKGKKEDDGPVFYNKVQVFNRDLSVVMLSLFAQWRFVERSVYASRKGKKGAEAEAAGAAEKARLYALSAAELDGLLEAEEGGAGIRVLDALAATGLRSIRYAKEVPGVKSVVSNDVDPDAAEACGRNIAENDAAAKCGSQCSDAVQHMIEKKATDSKNPKLMKSTYDVIDIDPYGSCAPFLDAALQCVSDGGMLCVTSTDMTVLSGGYPETCYGRYGSMPTKGRYLHEMALRIVLNTLETTANKYGRHIVPLLSLSVDFYIRCFVRVYHRPAEVKRSCFKRAFVLQSSGCPTFYLQPVAKANGPPETTDRFSCALLHKKPYTSKVKNKKKKHANDTKDDAVATSDAVVDSELEAPVSEEPEVDESIAPPFCGETGAAFKIGGPIWSSSLHEGDWVVAALDRLEAGVDRYLSTTERIHGVLTAVSEELPDVPLYYSLPDICGTLHCSSMKMAEVNAALSHAGYRCSQTHREPDAIKTDAPPRVLWDIFRCWVAKHPISDKRMAESTAAHAKILSVPPKLRANFATTAAQRAPKAKARRWAPNPEENWGPKAAAHGRKRPRAGGAL